MKAMSEELYLGKQVSLYIYINIYTTCFTFGVYAKCVIHLKS